MLADNCDIAEQRPCRKNTGLVIQTEVGTEIQEKKGSKLAVANLWCVCCSWLVVVIENKIKHCKGKPNEFRDTLGSSVQHSEMGQWMPGGMVRDEPVRMVSVRTEGTRNLSVAT